MTDFSVFHWLPAAAAPRWAPSAHVALRVSFQLINMLKVHTVYESDEAGGP